MKPTKACNEACIHVGATVRTTRTQSLFTERLHVWVKTTSDAHTQNTRNPSILSTYDRLHVGAAHKLQLRAVQHLVVSA
eukprot:4138916-Prymnesium_polylepis.1